MQRVKILHIVCLKPNVLVRAFEARNHFLHILLRKEATVQIKFFLFALSFWWNFVHFLLLPKNMLHASAKIAQIKNKLIYENIGLSWPEINLGMVNIYCAHNFIQLACGMTTVVAATTIFLKSLHKTWRTKHKRYLVVSCHSYKPECLLPCIIAFLSAVLRYLLQ